MTRTRLVALLVIVAVVLSTVTIGDAEAKNPKIKKTLQDLIVAVMGLEDRVTVLEEKTKVIKFGNVGTTPISAPEGQTGRIYLTAVNHPECVLNMVDLNPASPSTNFIQYD